MTKKAEDKLRREAFALGKRASAVRFALKHAGSGRAGAPKAELSDERLTELEARLEKLLAQRSELLARIAPAEATE